MKQSIYHIIQRHYTRSRTSAGIEIIPALALGLPGVSTGDKITCELSGRNAFNRPVSMKNDIYEAGYEYNAEGLRTGKTVTMLTRTKVTRPRT